MSISELTNLKSESDFTGSLESKAVIWYTAAWCGPCRALRPVLEALSGSIQIIKVDVDANPELATQQTIMSVPTLVVYDDGEEVNRIVGAKPKALLIKEFGI